MERQPELCVIQKSIRGSQDIKWRTELKSQRQDEVQNILFKNYFMYFLIGGVKLIFKNRKGNRLKQASL